MSESEGTTRRDVLKKAVFVAPIVLTFPARAAFAQSGSGRCNRGEHQEGQQGED
jgi:hypothetical protein